MIHNDSRPLALADSNESEISNPGPTALHRHCWEASSQSEAFIPGSHPRSFPCIYKPNGTPRQTRSQLHVTPFQTHGDTTSRDLENETVNGMHTMPDGQEKMFPGTLRGNLHTMPPEKPDVWLH